MSSSNSWGAGLSVQKILPMRASRDKNGKRLTVDVWVVGEFSVADSDPEGRTLEALGKLPEIDQDYGSTGLKVVNCSVEYYADERKARGAIEISDDGSNDGNSTSSLLDEWTYEGAANIVQTRTQKDINGANIALKYQPTGAPDVGDDKKYNRVIDFPTTEVHRRLSARKLFRTDPGGLAAQCLNHVSADKKWKCVGFTFPKMNKTTWDVRVEWDYSSKGWPEEVGFWHNPEDNTIPTDVELTNATTPASIGTTGKGSVRPSLFSTADFATILGVTMP